MKMNDRLKSILELLDQYDEVVNSKRNQEAMKLWENPYGWNRDYWRGIPASPSERNRIPITVCLDNAYNSKLLKINMIDYYTDPYIYLESQLKTRLFQFNNFEDDNVYTNELYIWFGVVTELSMLGAEYEFFPHKDPWIKNSVINTEEDIAKMSDFDFFKSGLMPQIHDMYNLYQDVVDDRFKIMFPSLTRGVFCLAAHLRRIDNLIYDIMLDGDFAHKIMRNLTDWHIKWTEQRNKFVGENNSIIKFYNDEVDCPTFSPQIISEFMLPYEIELAKHYGVVDYWHSCGNTTKFLKDIATIPNMRLFNVGPWTSYADADEAFGLNTALDICVNPQGDVLQADSKRMREKLIDIKEKCVHNNYSIRADAFMPFRDDPNEDLDHIKRWLFEAKNIFSI